MNTDKIPLSRAQSEIMAEFYDLKPLRVLFDKKERDGIWDFFKANNKQPRGLSLEATCPAILAEIDRANISGKNIQSAVFSECVYAQTLANLFNLNTFVNNRIIEDFIPEGVIALLSSYRLVARYTYSNSDKSRMLIQAGGHAGVDSALISVIDFNIYTIEFKERGAKTSEPDLPKYNEDGIINIDESFKLANPQFVKMLDEHPSFNVFENIGHNENDFSEESILFAISENYSSKKFADVICTEDKDGYLIMIPSNQVGRWARLEGELRTAGRNAYKVWTPQSLKRYIFEKGGTINGEKVAIPIANLEARRARGGDGYISGYKINQLFFVKKNKYKILGDAIIFNISSVSQLKATIAAKMFFNDASYSDIKGYYSL